MGFPPPGVPRISFFSPFRENWNQVLGKNVMYLFLPHPGIGISNHNQAIRIGPPRLWSLQTISLRNLFASPLPPSVCSSEAPLLGHLQVMHALLKPPRPNKPFQCCLKSHQPSVPETAALVSPPPRCWEALLGKRSVFLAQQPSFTNASMKRFLSGVSGLVVFWCWKGPSE